MRHLCRIRVVRDLSFMGTYAQVRGWFEVADELVPLITDIIQEIPFLAAKAQISADSIELYQHGWHIGEVINWTRYIFFGADIRAYYLDFYKNIFIKIALLQVKDEDNLLFIPEGLFYIDSEEGSGRSFTWTIKNGVLSEIPR